MEPNILARMHSAEHLLNGTMVRMFDCQRCFSAHLNKKKSKVDYHFPRALTTEEITEIETRVNAEIDKDLPMNEEMMDRTEAGKLFNLDRLPESAGDKVRIIRIGDYDAVPCIGDHVRSSAEIKPFRITTTDFSDGVLRIRFKLAS